MRIRLIEKIPILNKSGILLKYSEYLSQSGFKIDALIWIIISLFFAGAISSALLIISFDLWKLSALLFVMLADIFIGYPYLKAVQRLNEIEENLPDVLKQMADTLKAGGTYEYALKEVATSTFGALKKEMNLVLRKLEEGENLENSLNSLSENVDSRLVRRTISIIIDSVKSGAPLSDILEDISEDMKELHKIGRERKSRTLMQATFMIAAGAFVAPMIFSFVTTIINVLISASAGAITAQAKAQALSTGQLIADLIQIYIFIEVFATSIMISLMREGNMSKSLLYFPVLLFIAYVIYYASAIVSGALIGGF